MAICPKDWKPCIDDLCYGGGCLRMPDFPPLEQCSGCGMMIGIDGSDPIGDCTCDYENDATYDQAEDYDPADP